MIPRNTLLLYSLIFLSLISFVFASTPTSFCKCTCFSNSTIIQLGPPDSKTTSSADYNALYTREFLDGDDLDGDDESSIARNEARAYGSGDKKYRALNCNDCNRQFCLDYHLPKCKGAKESDVFTTCFQRDSMKDEAVVFIFVFATAGLLTWAAIRPWANKWMEAWKERRAYIPVSGQTGR